MCVRVHVCARGGVENRRSRKLRFSHARRVPLHLRKDIYPRILKERERERTRTSANFATAMQTKCNERLMRIKQKISPYFSRAGSAAK